MKLRIDGKNLLEVASKLTDVELGLYLRVVCSQIAGKGTGLSEAKRFAELIKKGVIEFDHKNLYCRSFFDAIAEAEKRVNQCKAAASKGGKVKPGHGKNKGEKMNAIESVKYLIDHKYGNFDHAVQLINAFNSETRLRIQLIPKNLKLAAKFLNETKMSVQDSALVIRDIIKNDGRKMVSFKSTIGNPERMLNRHFMIKPYVIKKDINTFNQNVLQAVADHFAKPVSELTAADGEAVLNGNALSYFLKQLSQKKND